MCLCGGRAMAECQAAVAEAVGVFGGVDILCCCDGEGGFAYSFRGYG